MINELRKETINTLRKTMGTSPEDNVNPDTKFHHGVKGIKVEMVDNSENPYKNIYEAAVATWGDERYSRKWDQTPPEGRFEVVKAALSNQTLPQVLETVNFMFIVRGASRSQFDQHARMRVGATFFSQGVRDNSRAEAGFRMPSELAEMEDTDLRERIEDHVLQGKDLYSEILKRGRGSYQSARSILPMGITHNYKWACNLQALKGYMAQRLQACEQEDTVFVAIATRDAIKEKFPLLASHLKPGCDHAKKCTYHQAYTLSEMFGCLFKGCGRWPDDNEYATFNRSSSNYQHMGHQGGIFLPRPDVWAEYSDLDSLEVEDLCLFVEA
ncbi:MAG: FAD-dependent thymidylate synthase [Candidatus Omnitrophica bacterium]|nr:FAD-dependent thymidylate synthase [Candidatus Omnitrophota bacterium]